MATNPENLSAELIAGAVVDPREALKAALIEIDRLKAALVTQGRTWDEETAGWREVERMLRTKITLLESPIREENIAKQLACDLIRESLGLNPLETIRWDEVGWRPQLFRAFRLFCERARVSVKLEAEANERFAKALVDWRIYEADQIQKRGEDTRYRMRAEERIRELTDYATKAEIRVLSLLSKLGHHEKRVYRESTGAIDLWETLAVSVAKLVEGAKLAEHEKEQPR